jgi:hypothetical protein
VKNLLILLGVGGVLIAGYLVTKSTDGPSRSAEPSLASTARAEDKRTPSNRGGPRAKPVEQSPESADQPGDAERADRARLARRARPVLPEPRRAALIGIEATDEEAAKVAEIERRRAQEFVEKDALELDDDENFEHSFEILDREERALEEVLGEERARLYIKLRADEVAEEVDELLR